MFNPALQHIGTELIIYIKRVSTNIIFRHCLKDIELALDTGYPMKLRHKLYQRHAKCLCEMYRFSEALKKFELAIESLEDSTLVIKMIILIQI